MNKHTPGPWIDSDGMIVHRMGDIARMESTNPADARLIAACPDLVEALQSTIEALERTLPADSQILAWNAVNDARAAINKATGETE